MRCFAVEPLSVSEASCEAHHEAIVFMGSCFREGAAGEVWRAEKASDFAWRARCLGVNDDPVVSDA